jgi:Lhr-like helicase
MPGARELLVETFPRGNKHYLICYPFEGRLAHQTLGMLLTLPFASTMQTLNSSNDTSIPA